MGDRLTGNERAPHTERLNNLRTRNILPSLVVLIVVVVQRTSDSINFRSILLR